MYPYMLFYHSQIDMLLSKEHSGEIVMETIQNESSL